MRIVHVDPLRLTIGDMVAVKSFLNDPAQVRPWLARAARLRPRDLESLSDEEVYDTARRLLEAAQAARGARAAAVAGMAASPALMPCSSS